MNLAQLISPEWAQDGFKERVALKRPDNALPPMGAVTRDSDRMTVDRVVVRAPMKRDIALPRRSFGAARMDILRALAAYRDGAWTGSGDLVREMGGDAMSINTACAVLPWLVKLDLVQRNGAPRSYKYAITAAGRKALG